MRVWGNLNLLAGRQTLGLLGDALRPWTAAKRNKVMEPLAGQPRVAVWGCPAARDRSKTGQWNCQLATPAWPSKSQYLPCLAKAVRSTTAHLVQRDAQEVLCALRLAKLQYPALRCLHKVYKALLPTWYSAMRRKRSVFSTLPIILTRRLDTRFTTCTCFGRNITQKSNPREALA